MTALKPSPSRPMAAPTQMDGPADHPIARFRPNELHRLFRLRHGRTLPNDDVGRRSMRRMLEALALSGPDGRHRAEMFIQLWCPWLPIHETDVAIEVAFRAPCPWSSKDLGDDLALTWTERDKARITTFRPAGVSDVEMAERRKQKAKERMQEKRRRQTLHPDKRLTLPAARAEAIAGILRPGERCAIRDICSEVTRVRHIRFANLKGRALSTAVHRAVDHGVGCGIFLKVVEPGVPVGTTWVTRTK